MTKLKPCPFCGGEAEYSKINTSNTVPFGTVQHFVNCKKNCLEGLYARGNTKEEAIKAWNTRPNPWHTGKPTEDGEYLVICQYVVDNYYYQEKLVWEFENGDWKNKQRFTEKLKIIAWYGQKITPFEEASE